MSAQLEQFLEPKGQSLRRAGLVSRICNIPRSDEPDNITNHQVRLIQGQFVATLEAKIGRWRLKRFATQ